MPGPAAESTAGVMRKTEILRNPGKGVCYGQDQTAVSLSDHYYQLCGGHCRRNPAADAALCLP